MDVCHQPVLWVSVTLLGGDPFIALIMAAPQKRTVPSVLIEANVRPSQAYARSITGPR